MRGEVRFIGQIQNIQEGFWIGVKLDEPYGKNDGTLIFNNCLDNIFRCKGTKYFECEEKYGLFVRPDKIEVGDFPEEDLMDLLDSDDDEI